MSIHHIPYADPGCVDLLLIVMDPAEDVMVVVNVFDCWVEVVQIEDLPLGNSLIVYCSTTRLQRQTNY